MFNLFQFIKRKLNNQLTNKDVLEFWSQPSPNWNDPAGYVKPLNRSKYLYAFMPKLSKKAKILEIGCNVGRNLNYLLERGFMNLYGIEINKNSALQMKKFYPQLYKSATIILDSTENAIFNFKDNYFTLIFSMASLMHHHPQSNYIFQQIYLKSKKYVLIIEDEINNKPLQFARIYKTIFENFGMKEIKKDITYQIEPNYPYTSRLFIKL